MLSVEIMSSLNW